MANNQQQDKWRDRELGTLYKKTSNDGSKTFLTGKINGKKVVVFSNAEYKEKRANEGADQETVDRLPDYTVYESEDQQQGGGNGGGYNNNQQQRRPQAQQSAPRSNNTRGGYNNTRGGNTQPQRRQNPPPAPAQGPLGEPDVAY
jgi:hypothetical protein